MKFLAGKFNALILIVVRWTGSQGRGLSSEDLFWNQHGAGTWFVW